LLHNILPPQNPLLFEELSPFLDVTGSVSLRNEAKNLFFSAAEASISVLYPLPEENESNLESSELPLRS
jgi:hypothetical protein